MHPKVKSRLFLTLIIILSITLGVTLLLRAMSDNIVFFYAPSEIPQTLPDKDIRVGGIVKSGSIIKLNPKTIRFEITDFKSELIIEYQGIIPVLFGDNQGIVANGKLKDGIFVARELLAKHDENYMPPELQNMK